MAYDHYNMSFQFADKHSTHEKMQIFPASTDFFLNLIHFENLKN